MTEPEVNADDVREELLKGGTTPPPRGMVEIELPPELAKAAANMSSVSGDWTKPDQGTSEAATPGPQRQKLPDDPFLDPEAISVSQLSTWGLDGTLKDIQVTEVDKAIFFKAAITDDSTPVIFDIDIEGLGYSVQVRSLHSFEELVLQEALRRDQGGRERKDGTYEYEKRVHDVATWVTFRQYYQAFLQVMGYQNKPRQNVELTDYGYAELDRCVEWLRLEAINWGVKVPGPLWSGLLQALHIYSAKIRVCRENLLNRDFWKPADIA